jgi:hypothetical protein
VYDIETLLSTISRQGSAYILIRVLSIGPWF